MPITLVEGLAPVWFVPESEKEIEEQYQTQFKIKPLTGSQYAEVMAPVLTAENSEGFPPKSIKAALRYGLLDWKNVLNDKNQPAKFSPYNVEKLPGEVLLAIAAEIVNLSSLGEEEIKN